MKHSVGRTCALLIAGMAACAGLLVGFGGQAFAASRLGPMEADAARPGASALPFPEPDGARRMAGGMDVAAHPASAEQPAPNPPSEIGPVIPSGDESGAKSSAWATTDRILLILVFLAGLVVVGFVAVKIIRNKRKPDA